MQLKKCEVCPKIGQLGNHPAFLGNYMDNTSAPLEMALFESILDKKNLPLSAYLNI